MIVRLMGGLGNQMFQYAMGKCMAEKRKEALFLDSFSYFRDRKRVCEIDSFQIKAKKPNFIYVMYYNFLYYFKLTRNKKICREKEDFKYQELNRVTAQYFIGSWQHEGYLRGIKDELRKEFVFKENLEKEMQRKGEYISGEAVAVHIRRGDYLQCAEYAVQDMRYYTAAMDYICQKLRNPKFYVFSDDISWCEEQFDKKENVIFVSGNTGKEDFFMMRKCKHFIISNSTYSWWAAWLADDGAIKVAPAKWFQDEDVNHKVLSALLTDFYVINSSTD